MGFFIHVLFLQMVSVDFRMTNIIWRNNRGWQKKSLDAQQPYPIELDPTN